MSQEGHMEYFKDLDRIETRYGWEESPGLPVLLASECGHNVCSSKGQIHQQQAAKDEESHGHQACQGDMVMVRLRMP